jgi:eukaryotic-like serine/threonine-protein kinase
VTVHGTAPLAPGGTATTSFTGGYREGNPLPTAFTLNNASCRATVTGATGTGSTGTAVVPPPGQPNQDAQQVADNHGSGSRPENGPGSGSGKDKDKAKGKGKG